jgi:hypothetical protein
LCPPVAYNNIERLTFQKAPLVDADRFYIQNAPNLFIEEFLDTLRSGVQIEESITQVCAHPSLAWASTSVELVCSNVPGMPGFDIGCAKGLTD